MVNMRKTKVNGLQSVLPLLQLWPKDPVLNSKVMDDIQLQQVKPVI